MTVKNKRDFTVWKFSYTPTKMGNFPKNLGGQAYTLSPQSKETVCLFMEKPDKKKTKLHLMKVVHLPFQSDSLFSTGNLHLSYYQHTLNFVKSLCPPFHHPFDAFYCPYRLKVITRPEDFLFSSVAFVIGAGNYSKTG